MGSRLKTFNISRRVFCSRDPSRSHRRGRAWKARPLLRIRYGQLNLDIFWLKDESLEDSANLPDPDILAAEID
jgi:type I restriction enzyme M protein